MVNILIESFWKFGNIKVNKYDIYIFYIKLRFRNELNIHQTISKLMIHHQNK